MINKIFKVGIFKIAYLQVLHTIRVLEIAGFGLDGLVP